ncbi:hypothetical protein C8Q80DRAFT_1179123 [Daedaleopsis nitida]|nr:hypothetical protein C8Q80DRAFT_1179123 [Daedaleopsis nitida]
MWTRLRFACLRIYRTVCHPIRVAQCYKAGGPQATSSSTSTWSFMSASITSNPHFGFSTSAEEVASALAPHIAGKVVLVTGVTPGGLGAHFLDAIAPHKPRLLILAGRSAPKLAEAAKAPALAAAGVATRTLELDLSSQASVRRAAAEVLTYAEPLDVLVNSAAVMACPYATTVDGLELQFGTNHIGHFLFTCLIAEKLLQSTAPGGARVVNVSSDGHRFSPIRFDDVGFSEGKTYEKWRAYGQSKTANILFALSLAEKLGPKGVTAYALHPGGIMTNLGRYMSDVHADLEALRAIDAEIGNTAEANREHKFKTLTQGTATYVVAAFDPALNEHSGAYLQDCQLAPTGYPRPYAADKGNAEKLWKLSEEIVGQTFSW